MIDPQILSFHMMLLNDADRMEKYRQAISDTVQPGNVVLDVGTGSGILAIFACQAGAKRVYAVDRSEVIVLARELAKANKLSDRIVFFQGDIKQIKLDEKIDVITSELIAKCVLGQNMAELIGFCRDKFLKPEGRILPEQVVLYIAPVETPITATPPAPSVYGIDFGALEQLSVNKPVSSRVHISELLSQALIPYSYQALTATGSDTFQADLTFEVERKGTLRGFAGWFSSVLSKGIEITNRPPGTASWDNLFFPLAKSIDVEPGMIVNLHFRGRCDSEVQEFWVWNTTVRSGLQVMAAHRQSSFAGRILSMDAIRKASDSWIPEIRSDGRIAQFILGQMNRKMSLREIAEMAYQEFPDDFVNPTQAIAHVRRVAELYGD